MIKAAILAMIPMAAQAAGWDEFHARCVDPYENLFPPIVEGLMPVASIEDQPGYWLSEAETLVIELAPDEGEMACRLDDDSGAAMAAFDLWIEQGVQTGRYIETGENAWASNVWIEPVLAVQKQTSGASVVLRIVVTDLES